MYFQLHKSTIPDFEFSANLTLGAGKMTAIGCVAMYKVYLEVSV